MLHLQSLCAAVRYCVAVLPFSSPYLCACPHCAFSWLAMCKDLSCQMQGAAVERFGASPSHGDLSRSYCVPEWALVGTTAGLCACHPHASYIFLILPSPLLCFFTPLGSNLGPNRQLPYQRHFQILQYSCRPITANSLLRKLPTTFQDQSLPHGSCVRRHTNQLSNRLTSQITN